MFVCSFVRSSHFGGLSLHFVVLCLPITLPLYLFPPSQVSFPSPSSLQFSLLHPILSLHLYLSLSPSIYLSLCLPQQQTLTSHQQLRLRSMPTRCRSALDGSPQAPHPHRTPSQPGMAQAAATSSQPQEPAIREMPSINEMVRQAGQSHTTPSALTSPASLAGIVSITHIRHT